MLVNAISKIWGLKHATHDMEMLQVIKIRVETDIGCMEVVREAVVAILVFETIPH